MPIYVFRCRKCRMKFDKIVGFGTERIKCDYCGDICDRVFDCTGIGFEFKTILGWKKHEKDSYF